MVSDHTLDMETILSSEAASKRLTVIVQDLRLEIFNFKSIMI